MWKQLLTLKSPAGKHAQLQIFSFHRVLNEASNFWADDPDIALFDRQIKWITQSCNLLRLDEAVDRLNSGTLPAAAAAIPFDDGYKNNLTNALTVLEKYHAPATIFITIEACENGIMWNDLVIEGIRCCQAPFKTVVGGTEQQIDRNRNPQEILDAIKYLPHQERWSTAQSFFMQATDGAKAPRLMMTPSEITECRSDLITFGAHTLTHPILKELDDETCRAEIEGSKRFVEEWTQTPVTLFAYPNGRYGIDFAEREIDLAKSAGFKAAVATDWGSADTNSNNYSLPRYTPWERSSFAFKMRILKTSLSS